MRLINISVINLQFILFQIVNIGVNERSTNATNIFFYWWMPIPQNNLTFEFLPSITNVKNNATWNATKWIEDNNYQFNNLEPYTLHTLTVYVRVKGSNVAYPPSK